MEMNERQQVGALVEAGAVEGMLAATHTFCAVHISHVIAGCKRVVDLGCGPAGGLSQLAAIHPATEFVGVDLSREALAFGQRRALKRGLDNLRFVEGDFTDLSAFPDGSVDGVVSTLALHHLPSLAFLERCFDEIHRVLSPGGAIFLTDLLRPKSPSTVRAIAGWDRERQSPQFVDDYKRSLRAAFVPEDFLSCAKRLPTSRFFATFPALLAIIKTDTRPVSSDLAQRLRWTKSQLSQRGRKDIDLFRWSFRKSGLFDPFATLDEAGLGTTKLVG